MLKSLIVIPMFLLVVTATAFAGSDVNFKPGKWEITTTMEMAGGMTMPPQTFTQCMTKENIVPQNTQPGQECKITETKHSGNAVTWKMTCKSAQGNMTGNGKIVYSGSAFDGKMTMSLPAANMKFSSEMKGRRIGKCD